MKVGRSCWTPRPGRLAELLVLPGMVSSNFSPRSPTQQRSPDNAYMLLEVLSGSTDPVSLVIRPFAYALHGIVKCTGLDVAKWAGALAREHPAYPLVELLIRRVWGEDDPTEATSEVIFARSTLIGREGFQALGIARSYSDRALAEANGCSRGPFFGICAAFYACV